MTQYAAGQQVRDLAVEGLKGLDAAPLDDLLEAASRIFDIVAEVPTDYFAPAPPVAVWQPLTEFEEGALIVPTVRNARLYKLTNTALASEGGGGGGVMIPGGGPAPPEPSLIRTGETEPNWPRETDATVEDGGYVWTDQGFEGTIRVFYGDGTDFLFLPPYVPGSLGAVLLPDTIPGIEFREVDGGLMRTAPAYDYPLSLTDPAAWRDALYLTSGRRPWEGWAYNLPIQVIARWGWLITPPDVRQATIQIATKLYRENDPAFVKVQEIDGQVIREEIPPTAAAVARKYRERAIRFDAL